MKASEYGGCLSCGVVLGKEDYLRCTDCVDNGSTGSRALRCRHDRIIVYADDAGSRMWACASCAIRMYPACRTCIDVGHRNEDHVATLDAARAETPGLDALTNALYIAAGDPDEPLLTLGEGTQRLWRKRAAAILAALAGADHE